MTYSSALFDDMNEPLERAQERKYARLAEALDIQPGDRVLEIGCGWGGFAEFAASKFDCEIVGLTISTEQAQYARTRMAKAGLADQVDIRLQDYRDVDGLFDKIVSIEMFEAVGVAHWPIYFDTLRKRLKPGGRAAVQTITIEEARFDAYRRTPDFIQHYIFREARCRVPNGLKNAQHLKNYRFRTRASLVRLMPKPCADGTRHFWILAGASTARLRRALSPYVALLPLLFRGRIRYG